MSDSISILASIEYTPTNTSFGGVYDSVAEPSTPITKKLDDYVASIMDEEGRIYKSSFNPMRMQKDLSNICLMKIIDGGEDFLVTVYGTNASEITGADYTNCLLSNIPDTRWRIPYIQKVIATEQRLIIHNFMGHPANNHFLFETIYYPLYAKNGDISHILVAFNLIEGKLCDAVSPEVFENAVKIADKFYRDQLINTDANIA